MVLQIDRDIYGQLVSSHFGEPTKNFDCFIGMGIPNGYKSFMEFIYNLDHCVYHGYFIGASQLEDLANKVFSNEALHDLTGIRLANHARRRNSVFRHSFVWLDAPKNIQQGIIVHEMVLLLLLLLLSIG